MLVDAVLDVVFGVLGSIVGLFPTNTLELTGLNAGASYLSWVGQVVDVAALAWAVGLIATVEGALVVVRVSLFLWRLTPFSG